MTDDPLCSEEPLEGSDDDCCVAVFCSTESEDEDYYSTEYDTSEDTPELTSGGTSSGLATKSIFLFFTKSLINLMGANQRSLVGGICTCLFSSSQQLSRLRLELLKGFLSWHGALQGPLTRLVHCFRNYRDTRALSGEPR